MKIIFSHCHFLDSFWVNKEMAELSNKLVKNIGYKTCLYTDQKGYDILSDINYDEIILFDQEQTNNFPKKIWSMGKILAMSLVNEPFMHIDFDVFIFKKIQEHLIQKDFFTCYAEPWLTKTDWYATFMEEIYQIYPDKNDLNINKFLSHNFCIIGGTKFKEINFVCNKILNFIKEYKNEILEIDNKFNNINSSFQSWSLAVLFEQILIPNMLETIFDIRPKSIFSDPVINVDNLYYTDKTFEEYRNYLKQCFIENKILHLHGDKNKKFSILKSFIQH